ncbi:MAG: hypothetical protein E7399_02865 [Ruminococcaceae bacterium]|nr:hypothetical protein [Oscillospiraceae bacterium]
MKKGLHIGAMGIIIIAYCAWIISRICQMPINADAACMILEAEDILAGNLFLKDWSLTGITFLTTDLPYYIIGTAIAGVSLNAYRIAVSLMFLVMLGCAVLLCLYGSKRKWFSFAIFAGMGLFPTFYALSNTFVHTAVFSFFFLTVLLVLRTEENPSRRNFTVLGILVALAVCGDGLALVLITLPLLALCLFRVVKKPVLLAVCTIGGTVAGLLLQKLYLLFGADMNSLLHSEFIAPAQLVDNVLLYIEYVLRLLNAYFFEKEVFSLKTAFYAVKILLFLLTCGVMYRSIRNACKKEATDLPSLFTGIGFGLMTLILWLTTFSVNITTGRYIAFLPLLMGILLAKWAEGFPLFQKPLPIAAAVLLSFCLAATNALPKDREPVPENVLSRMATFLEEEGLTSGYAAFWDSTSITVYSEGHVNVRAVMYSGQALRPREWFCKKSWYDEEANFVLIKNEDSVKEEDTYRYNGIFNSGIDSGYRYEVTRENVEKFLGSPTKTKEFENYTILIYDTIQLEKSWL